MLLSKGRKQSSKSIHTYFYLEKSKGKAMNQGLSK